MRGTVQTAHPIEINVEVSWLAIRSERITTGDQIKKVNIVMISWPIFGLYPIHE